jgi:hypothetical protein
MADKGTTPETPQNAEQGAQQTAPAGPRRKKRAAPTIDLTATEMPSPEAAASPPPDPPPFDKAATRAGGSTGVAALVAGLVGAAAVTLVLAALWLTGLLPVRYETAANPQSQADTKTIDTLSQRVSKIEEAIKKLPADESGMAERLAAADGAMKSLGIALTALNRRGDDIAASVAQARERADVAVKVVTELRASLQDAAKTSAAAISPAELDALQKRIAALEQSAQAARADIAKASSADIPARLALSAALLRVAVMNGEPFAAELAQAKALGADEKVLAPLAPFTAAGLPAAHVMAQELRALLPAMLKISGAQAPKGGFLERLQANAGKLVHIRPVDAPPGDDPSALLARLEIDAAKADIAAALGDLGKLAEATRAPAQAWIEKAQARQAALTAARQYATDTARALGPR